MIVTENEWEWMKMDSIYNAKLMRMNYNGINKIGMNKIGINEKANEWEWMSMNDMNEK